MLVMVVPFSIHIDRGACSGVGAELFAPKSGLALLHECAPTLGVILAVEACFDHRLEPGEIAFCLRLADLAGGGFGKSNRQRRVLSYEVRGLGDGSIKLAVWDDALHETHLEGLLGRELPAGVNDLEGLRQAYALGKAAHTLQAVAQT